jgi:hypothetical protein
MPWGNARPVMTITAAVVAVGVMLCCFGQTALGARQGQLVVTVVDSVTGKPVPCRMHLMNSAGRPRKQRKLPFWHDHFAMPGEITLRLPLGNYTFEIERGPEYVTRSGHFRIEAHADDTKTVDLKRFVDMSKFGWWSGDLDVRRPVSDIELLMKADDLHVAQVITWQGTTNQWKSKPAPENPVVNFDGNRYYHLLAGGYRAAGTELLMLNLSEPFSTVVKGEYPPSIHYATEARRQPGAWIDVSKPFWWDLPMLVANRQVDSVQIANSHVCRKSVIGNEADGKPRDKLLYPDPSGNARWSQQIYFHLLNCGLRIPPSAGSGSGVSPNPVGYNRMYVHVDGQFSYERWFESFKAGRVTVTNGPLLRPKVEGQLPGHVFTADKGEELDFEIGLTLSTRQPISYLELVQDGKVKHSISFDQYAKSGRLPKLHFDRSGWFLVRAVTDLDKTYRFAMTGPYYVEIGYEKRISKNSAQFFYDWVYERARQIQITDKQQRLEVLGYHRTARDFWKALVAKANAE